MSVEKLKSPMTARDAYKDGPGEDLSNYNSAAAPQSRIHHMQQDSFGNGQAEQGLKRQSNLKDRMLKSARQTFGAKSSTENETSSLTTS